MTTKRDRFPIVTRGGTADHPPVGAWVHYGSAGWSPWQMVGAHLGFYHDYDWNSIKIMHDYRIDLPEELEKVTSPAQFGNILANPRVLLDNHTR